MALSQEDKKALSKGTAKVVVEMLKPIYEFIERLAARVERLEKGVDQVEVGLLVDKVTVLEARLRDIEYELVKLRERDEEVPSPWQ